MAVLAIGLAAIAWLRVSGPELALERVYQAGVRAQRVATALSLYQTRHGALPEPEQGTVPWRLIGLAPQDIADPWGRPFVYGLSACGWTLSSTAPDKEPLRWSAASCQDPRQG